VGGTFTDFVLCDAAGQIHTHKLLTSCLDPSLAILQGISDLGVGSETVVVHGATVATNALLERHGAKTALIATRGFGDVIEIGRQNRTKLYSLYPTRPEPLVPAAWRFEVTERVDRQGQVLTPLDMDTVEAAASRLLAEGLDSVAVCLLFSFLNPSHEQMIRERIRDLTGSDSIFVSLSSDVLPEYREYERTSTTVINAYVGPLITHYLSRLEQGLSNRRLRIMQSNGGSISARAAGTLAARTALSGPAAGVVGAFEVASRAGWDLIITFDMGGTSTDVALCAGRIRETTEGMIAGLPLRLPMIDIHTVGAGGGSIARRDAGGALCVGPESAGSDPGPVSYGQPGAQEITVTDANLLLGRLDAEHFLGGRMKLDVARTRSHMQHLAERLGLSPQAAAWGVIRVANSNMERAIRSISVERGFDPRLFTLVAFGGAGPLHACELAAALQIPRVLVPRQAGVLSALGMVLADLVKDYSQTVMLPAEGSTSHTLNRLFAPLRARALADMRAEGLEGGLVSLIPTLDMRYVGQSYELSIPWDEGQPPSVGRFHAEHLRRFSYAMESEPVEIVNVRLKAVGATPKPHRTYEPPRAIDRKAAAIGQRHVHFADGHEGTSRPVLTAEYERERLVAGQVIGGPAIVYQTDSTLVLPPRWVARVDGWGNMIAEQSG
jgi:N-methylhydantoinase A